MATVQGLEAEAKRAKDELAKARREANRYANARKRAAKSLDKWLVKNSGLLSTVRVGAIESVCAMLDPEEQ
jgi:hypothetical protein